MNLTRARLLVFASALVAIGLAGIVVTASLTTAELPYGVCPGGVCGRVPQAVGVTAVDATFVEQMVPHHEDAIAMAGLALKRSERPEIRDLAQDIVRTQRAENDLMRGWYRDWFGTAVPETPSRRTGPGMMSGMMGSAAGLERLEDTEDFDRAFIETMVPHHRMGVMMATMAGDATRRTDVRELTARIIESQSEEIDRMLAWYREWYGR